MQFGAATSNGLPKALSRTKIPFSAVNRKGCAGYNPEFQKHHILPSAIERRFGLAPMIHGGLRHSIDLHDFRINGVLLPSTERQAHKSKLPMHRGPHPIYSEMVEERVATIQSALCARRQNDRIHALQENLMRIDLLIKALRKKILSAPGGRAMLNRHCPLGVAKDFSQLDEMAEQLWQATSDIPERDLIAA